MATITRDEIVSTLEELGRLAEQDVEPFLIPGDQPKAQFAFDDLWETLHGDIGSNC